MAADSDAALYGFLGTLLGAVIAAAAGLTVSLLTSWHRAQTERERSDESISLKLLEMRVKPYAALMKQLAKVSTLHLNEFAATQDEAGSRAQALAAFNALHEAIYGQVGVLANTVTRETILCARRRCKAYADGEGTRDDMLAAVWAVHQMLRSDLNHHQDRITREFDRVRTRFDRNMTAEVIEYLVEKMPHVQFVATPPRVQAASWWQLRRKRKQARVKKQAARILRS